MMSYKYLSVRPEAQIPKSIRDATIFMPLGGQGSRARKYTKGRYSKFLIPLERNFTVLDMSIQSLLSAGFRQYVFCVGTLFPGEIVEKILSYKTVFDDLGCTYKFSFEHNLLGGVGAYNKAIAKHNINGPIVSIPGDMFLPWDQLEDLITYHLKNNCAITVGLTDLISTHTTEVGKIWIDAENGSVTRCLARDEESDSSESGIIKSTSAGLYIADAQKLRQMYAEFCRLRPDLKRNQIEMRDQLLPWSIQDSRWVTKGFDLHKEILDVGDYDRILFAKKHWREYLPLSQV